MDANVFFLVLTFAVSVLGMLAFVVALIQKQVLVPKSAGDSIFGEHERGCSESDDFRSMREAWGELDQSARGPILFFLISSVIWLVIGSVLGLLVSIKFNAPTFLGSTDFLTFGKLRPLHLNLVIYGWLSFAGLGLCLWLVPRMTKVPHRYNAIL